MMLVKSAHLTTAVCAAIISLFVPIKAFPQQSETMTFILGGTDHRIADADWIQAEGTITDTTVEDFLNFINSGPEWLPRRIRFNSPGGNLAEGMQLGEILRSRGFATEVGSHEPHPDWPNMSAWDFTRRTPGHCASACAYAFMGGVERRVEPGSFIGVHQFYSVRRDSDGSNYQQNLVRQGSEQEVVSLLLDYMLRMGIDSRVLIAAGLSGPEEMYWIGAGPEAQETGLSYTPNAWSEWEIQLSGSGVVAQSYRQDRRYRMMAFCTNTHGAFFELFVTETPEEQEDGSFRRWLTEQCLPAGSISYGQGYHGILGNRVNATEIQIVERSSGFALIFPLGFSPGVEGSPSFLYDDAPFMACTTGRFVGNETSMRAAARIAFRNCVQ